MTSSIQPSQSTLEANADHLRLLRKAVIEISGKTLGQLSETHHITVPDNLMSNKGWIGQLIETSLGVNNNSRPEPDFPDLGIELKTLPVNQQGKPKESTYVCVAPLQNLHNTTFENSLVGKKLRHILWIPIEADPEIPLEQRKVGQGVFWKPNQQEWHQLHQDFDEITDQIALGQVENITAHQGVYLQLRPKAANSKALTAAYSPDGETMMTLPRGFYLRTVFTEKILQHYF